MKTPSIVSRRGGMRCAVALAALTAPLTAAPAPLRAQTPRGAGVSVDLHIAIGDHHHEGLRPLEALEAYEKALAADPARYAALWKASREAVTLGMLAGSDRVRRVRFEQAEEYGRRATEANPEGARGHQWLAIALGRLALTHGPLTRARLGHEVQEAALRTLALDSLSAGAHHVLGQWHAEVRRLSGASRFVAATLLGGQGLDEASWETAVAHLERAVDLAPGALIHRLELARAYRDVGRPDDAREQLREVLERPALDAIDPMLKQEAQRLLRELD